MNTNACNYDGIRLRGKTTAGRVGNRTWASNATDELTYLINELNQYTNITDGITLEPQYDLDGNLTNYNGWAFTWNGENRLIAATNTTTHTALAFAYDHMGRRIRKTVVSGVSPETNTTAFIYDGWNLIAEESVQSVSSVVTNFYTWGLDLSGSLQGAGGIGGLLSANINGTNLFYSYDANGNVTALADANGATAAHYEYDPFGNRTLQSGSAATQNPFRFSTKYLDTQNRHVLLRLQILLTHTRQVGKQRPDWRTGRAESVWVCK